MRRLSVGVSLACALAFAATNEATAQARFSVAGGIASPMSDLGDVADLGYSVGAGLNFRGSRTPIGARLEGALNSFGLKSFPEDVRVLNATANAVVDLGQQPASPYLIGGLGLYFSKFGNADSENAVGVNLGGGLRFPIGNLDAFFEARYHAMLGESGARTNLQFIPITLGVTF